MGRRRPEPRQLFVDTGGTFTDVVGILSDGTVVAVKVRTDPDSLVDSIEQGIRKLAARLSMTEERVCRSLRRVGISTSAALDALRRRKGRRVGLIVTRGQEGAIEVDAVRAPAPQPTGPAPVPIARLIGRTRLVSRELVLGVTERIDPQGRILEPLREDEARLAARRLRDRGVDAVVVITLFDFANPVHEKRILEIVREEIGPSIPVTMGIDVSPILRDWSRTTAAVVDAGARPVLEQLYDSFVQALRARGCKHEPVVMRAGGGVAALPYVRCLDTIRAGPIGACRAAAQVGAVRGLDEILLADIGGESFEIAWVGRGPGAPPTVDGSALVSSMSLAQVHRVAPGASARAWVEPPVGLRVGQPPGEALTPPACFAWGSDLPTITDADLVLGYVSGRQPGGAIPLDSQLAREAIEERIARPLRVGLVEAADAIRRQADALAGDAVHRYLARLGISPPSVTMVVGGGCGPVHAAGLAEVLRLRAVLIPPGASVLGALGSGVAPTEIAMERSVSVLLSAKADRKDHSRAAVVLTKVLDELAEAALGAVRRHGLPVTRANVSRLVALRSERMVDDVLLPLNDLRAGAAAPIERLLKAFDREAARDASLLPRDPDGHVEVYAVCVCASVPSRVTPPRRVPGAGRKPPKSAIVARRAACFGGQMVPTDVYDLAQVRPGNTITGPALLEGNATTVVLPSRFHLTMEKDRVLRLFRKGAS